MRRQHAESAPTNAARGMRAEAWLAAAVASLLVAAWMFGLPSNHAVAAPGDFTVAPTALDFGDVAIGVTAGPIDVVITNVDVSGHDPQVSGGSPNSFQFFHSTECPDLVDAGESCVASYYFSPLSNGTYTASAMLAVDGELYPITLTGTGVAATPPTTTTEPSEATTSTTTPTTTTTASTISTTTPPPDCSTTTTTPPSIATQVDPCVSPTTLVSAGGGALPPTGSNSSIVIALAALLVLAGGAMVVVRRRS